MKRWRSDTESVYVEDICCLYASMRKITLILGIFVTAYVHVYKHTSERVHELFKHINISLIRIMHRPYLSVWDTVLIV